MATAQTFVARPIFLADSGSFPQDLYEQLEVVAGPVAGERVISGVGERFGPEF